MSDVRCKERIWGSRVSSAPCSRSAGFGPNGAYCKQHALKHQANEAKHILFSIPAKTYTWENAKVDEINVVSFTDQTYTDLKGRRNGRNTDWNLTFETKDEAVDALIKRAEKQISHAQGIIEGATAFIERMKR